MAFVFVSSLTFATMNSNDSKDSVLQRWATTFTSSCGVTTTIYASSAQEMYDNMVGFEKWSCI